VRLELAVEIARPPQDVYAYLADPTNLPRWQEEVEAVEHPGEGALAGGATFRERRTFLGRRLESTVEVVASEPGREFTIRTRGGPVPFTVEHLLRETGEGLTELRVTATAQVPSMLKLVARGAERAVRARFERDFARLKQVLEAG
jgi:carbon monoxide dehydrogenase subunit G